MGAVNYQDVQQCGKGEKLKYLKNTSQTSLGITQSCISKSMRQRRILFNYDSFPYYRMKAIGTSKQRDRDHNLTTEDHRKYSVDSKLDYSVDTLTETKFHC